MKYTTRRININLTEKEEENLKILKEKLKESGLKSEADIVRYCINLAASYQKRAEQINKEVQENIE